MRLFLDANVLFSAAITPTGRSSALFDLAGGGRDRLTMSAHPIEEARRNITLRHPEAEDRLADLTDQLSVVPEGTPEIFKRAESYGLPMGDAAVLAAAVRSRADLLVTGDRKHFGELFGQRIDGVLVVTIADAVSRLLRSED